MGIGTWYHAGLAVVNLLTGNVPGTLVETCAAIKSYGMGKIMEPIIEPIKETLGDWVGETCDPDIVENFPYF